MATTSRASALGVGVAGGALAFGVGALFAGAIDASLGVAIPFALVGAANGALSGWRRIYDWRHLHGAVAFLLDSTWAIPTTAAAVFANTVGLVQRDSGYVADLSERCNRHVYERGFTPRKGFAITLGNVICGAGDVSRDRRRRLITDHEGVHVWQARWFGPAFPVLYVGWVVLGGAAGLFVWTTRRRDQPIAKVVESFAYFLNPFEWWAYSRDDHWPPTGIVTGLGWRKAIVRPFRTRRT